MNVISSNGWALFKFWQAKAWDHCPKELTGLLTRPHLLKLVKLFQSSTPQGFQIVVNKKVERWGVRWVIFLIGLMLPSSMNATIDWVWVWPPKSCRWSKRIFLAEVGKIKFGETSKVKVKVLMFQSVWSVRGKYKVKINSKMNLIKIYENFDSFTNLLVFLRL